MHPAAKIPFDELWNGLSKACADGYVRTTERDGLHLFCYAEKTTYERAWNPITISARGIILDPEAGKIVALPFPKFFNLGEHGVENIPDGPFTTYEKLDGSLIIIYHHDGKWKTATKGSLNSTQAQWAAKWLETQDLSVLETDFTYLAEAIYPENKIVVSYDYDGLVLLGAYNRVTGEEVSFNHITAISIWKGWKAAKTYAYNSISHLIELAKTLPVSEEGFILKFANGLRLKVKGEEYVRIHRLVSNLTPLAVWEAMMLNKDMLDIKKELPEEFLVDYESIMHVINDKIMNIMAKTELLWEETKHLTDKEVGQQLNTYPEDIRSFLFPRRKHGTIMEGRTRETVFRSIRPTGNVLEGYTPSYAMKRVQTDA